MFSASFVMQQPLIISVQIYTYVHTLHNVIMYDNLAILNGFYPTRLKTNNHLLLVFRYIHMCTPLHNVITYDNLAILNGFYPTRLKTNNHLLLVFRYIHMCTHIAQCYYV